MANESSRFVIVAKDPTGVFYYGGQNANGGGFWTGTREKAQEYLWRSRAALETAGESWMRLCRLPGETHAVASLEWEA